MNNIVHTPQRLLYYAVGLCIITIVILLQANYGLAVENSASGQLKTAIVKTTGESGSISNLSDFTCQPADQISLAECMALVDLYQSTNGTKWHNNSGWLNAPNLCEWYGLICDEDGLLIGIDLHDNRLQGTLPNSLGNLKNLHLLGLWENQLSGTIPSSIGNLTALSILDLSNNSLTGPLPTEMKKLSNLTSLWACNNQLSGPIPSQLNELDNLKSLNLESNQLSGDFPLALIDKPALTELLLGHNALIVPTGIFRTSIGGHMYETQTVPPIDLTVTQVNNGSVSLMWTPTIYEGDEGNYQISYRAANEADFTGHVTTESKKTQQVLIDGLTPNTTYYFAIRTLTKAHALQQNDLWSVYSKPVAVELALLEPQLSAADLAITAMEVTQGLQNLTNDMPLVADRLTWVRVYAQADRRDIPNMQAQLHAFRNGSELADSPLSMEGDPITVKETGGDRLNLEDSFQFALSESWLNGTVTFRAELKYGSTITDTDSQDNNWEETVTFHQSKPLSLVMVPIKLHKDGDATQPESVYRTTEPGFEQIIDNAYRYMPVAKINWREHDQILEADCGGSCDIESQADPSAILLDLEQMRSKAEEVDKFFQSNSNEHWVGMVDPALLFGGLAIRPDKAFWRAYSAFTTIVSMYGPTDSSPYEIGGSLALMHEIGHNLGMMHIDCNAGEGNPSPTYPYSATANSPCTLDAVDESGFYGFDVYYEATGTDAPLVISNGNASNHYQIAYPMMSYKYPGWTSPYKYCQLLIKFGVECDLYPYEDTVTGTNDEPAGFIDLEDAHMLSNRHSDSRRGESTTTVDSHTDASVIASPTQAIDPPADQEVLLEDGTSISTRIIDVDPYTGESEYTLGALYDPKSGYSTSNGQMVYYVSELKNALDDRIGYTVIDRAGNETNYSIEVVIDNSRGSTTQLLPIVVQ